MTLSDFLFWLAGGGGAIIVCSFVFERLEFFQKLGSEQKRMVMFGACIAISLGAFAVQQFVAPNILAAIAPYFAILVSTFTSLFVSQKFHESDKVDTTEE